MLFAIVADGRVDKNCQGVTMRRFDHFVIAPCAGCPPLFNLDGPNLEIITARASAARPGQPYLKRVVNHGVEPGKAAELSSQCPERKSDDSDEGLDSDDY